MTGQHQTWKFKPERFLMQTFIHKVCWTFQFHCTDSHHIVLLSSTTAVLLSIFGVAQENNNHLTHCAVLIVQLYNKHTRIHPITHTQISSIGITNERSKLVRMYIQCKKVSITFYLCLPFLLAEFSTNTWLAGRC